MTAILTHRGPDDCGFFYGAQASLGARRLSIIDIAGGHQPTFNEDKTITVIQNGEIFNYRELQTELKGKGHRLASRGDTEVLAHLYEEYGADFCQKLNGDFAIALWDDTQARLLLARDRFGVHPLYYTIVGREMAFASELKSLLCWEKVDRSLDPAAIDAYLALRYVPEEKTFFKNIQKLKPGCTLLFTHGELQIRPYWTLPQPSPPPRSNLNSAAEELLSLLKDSVNIRLRADVPVGAYLSGGIDSSLIVGLMRQLNTGPIKTFSIGFGLETDELEEARKTAAREQTDHHEIMIEKNDYELLPKIVWHLDEPIGDSIIIPNFRLSQAAARAVKVVTSGEGADEVWGGYIHHLALNTMGVFDHYLPRSWSRLAGKMTRMTPRALIDYFFPYPAALGVQGQEVLSQYLLHHACGKSGAEYLALASLYRPDEKKGIYTAGFSNALGSNNALEKLLEGYYHTDQSLLENTISLDMNNWLPNYTLFRQDKIGFANSLEIRVPYLDHRIVEFAMQQPDAFKIKGLITKRLLRKAASKVLPQYLSGRRKRAFYFPVQSVFGEGYRQFVRDILGTRRCMERGILTPDFLRQTLASLETQELLQSKRIIALVILELWFQTFVDGTGLTPMLRSKPASC